MQFGKRIGPLARRVAAMQIPVYAGNASFFLLLSVFPVVSLLLSLLPYTPLTLDHLLAFCEEFAPDWTLRALEFFVRTLYASSSAAIVAASAVLTLWSASKGMLSLLYGLDAVAEVRETRGYVQRRLLCVLYTVGMLLALLLVQVLGLPFCLLYMKLAEKFGARTMVGVGICVYMFICVFAFFMNSLWQFWMLAVLCATSQGGIQALSRSMFGKLIPDKSAAASSSASLTSSASSRPSWARRSSALSVPLPPTKCWPTRV